MTSFQYPPSPVMVDAGKLTPSAAFKKQVVKVITAIFLFFVVYILLVIAAVGLAIACCYFGIILISAVANFMALVAGLGLVAVGVSVIFFLIKFIFTVSKNENPSRIEIKEQDQPKLFEFIRRLSNETKTPFPRKIFVSPDVNAAVFYNSSFWSMLFPVRKNLEIGLGLVNSINLSELKAVIAHEFGHFSQRSMKLGSFTYNVNRIIYDMLYNNKSYTSFLNAWGRLHGILSFFATITVKIAQGIQYILKEMYKVINKSYMGLSREMEFHADAVAASVAGGNNVISGLSRLEIAASCYNTTLNKADELLKENKKLDNIYNNQRTVYNALASQYKLPVKQGLPEVSFDFIKSFSSSRINYKNQWASHPNLDERKAHLDILNINVEADEFPAWSVVNDPKYLQEQVTEKLYSQVKTESSLQLIDSNAFDEFYKKQTTDYTLPALYKGYYDRRFIDIKDWDIDELSNQKSSIDFNALFTEDNAQLQSSVNNNYEDIETLKAIRDKQIDTKSFDFDGVKYNREDCDAIIQQLEKEIEETQIILKQLDKDAFVLFNNYVANLNAVYNQFKTTNEKYDSYSLMVNELLEAMQPLYKGGLTVDQVEVTISRVKNVHERALKKQINVLMSDGILAKETDVKIFNDAEAFMQKNYRYYVNGKFMNDELSSLRDIAIQTANAYYDYKFKQYKNLLEHQLSGYHAIDGNI
jgi:Zn-dependent protease with chaperone function